MSIKEIRIGSVFKEYYRAYKQKDLGVGERVDKRIGTKLQIQINEFVLIRQVCYSGIPKVRL